MGRRRLRRPSRLPRVRRFPRSVGLRRHRGGPSPTPLSRRSRCPRPLPKDPRSRQFAETSRHGTELGSTRTSRGLHLLPLPRDRRHPQYAGSCRQHGELDSSPLCRRARRRLLLSVDRRRHGSGCLGSGGGRWPRASERQRVTGSRWSPRPGGLGPGPGVPREVATVPRGQRLRRGAEERRRPRWGDRNPQGVDQKSTSTSAVAAASAGWSSVGPMPIFSLIFFSSSLARSGLSRKKFRAFSRPWPSWSLS
jgi:hypothetical protein